MGTPRKAEQDRFIDYMIENAGRDNTPQTVTRTTIAEREAADINQSILTSMAEAKAVRENFGGFIADVKTTLLGECLNTIYYNVLNKVILESELDIETTKRVIASYLKENGTEKVMHNIRYTSTLLSEMYQLVEKYTARVTEECKRDKDKCGYTFKVPNDTKDDFYNELDMIDSEDVIFQIGDRVSSAMNDFVTTNTLSKLDIKSVLDDSQERLQAVKGDAQRESVERVAGDMIHDIKNSGYHGIFAEMVKVNTCSVMKNPVLRESLMDGTTLNMKKIVDSCKYSYALMETMIGLRIEPVSEEIIMKYLTDMKK